MTRLAPAIALAGLLSASQVTAAPPRVESPAPRETLRSFGQGSSDEEMLAAITAANAHPLGTLRNPIRVGGPEGANAYVARLRCADGSAPAKTKETPGAAGAYGTLTRTITLSCRTGAPVDLAFDFYQEEYRETRPAPGFTAAP